MFHVKESKTTQASSLIDSLDVLALDMANSSQTNVTEMENVGRYSLNIEYAPLKLSAYPVYPFCSLVTDLSIFWNTAILAWQELNWYTCAFSSIFDKTFIGLEIISRASSVNN